MTDKQREKMEYRNGCFVTKSQAKKIDSLDVDYVEYFSDDEILIGIGHKEYFMSTRGKVEYYNDNGELVTL